MKTTLTAKWILCICSSLIIWSCYSCESEHSNETSTSFDPTYEDCSIDCAFLRPSSYEITKACADCLTGNFIKNNYHFPLYKDTSKNTRGFQVHRKEIQQLFDSLHVDTRAEIYTMMGIYYEQGNANKESDVKTVTPELVFVIKYPSVDTFRYFNFTQPCPTYCPTGGNIN